MSQKLSIQALVLDLENKCLNCHKECEGHYVGMNTLVYACVMDRVSLLPHVAECKDIQNLMDRFKNA